MPAVWIAAGCAVLAVATLCGLFLWIMIAALARRAVGLW